MPKDKPKEEERHLQVVDADGEVASKRWCWMDAEEQAVMQEAFRVAAKMSNKPVKAVIFGEFDIKQKKDK